MGNLNAFQALIQEAIGDEAVQHVADRCGVPRWILDDLFRRGSVPRDRYLQGIADGLALDYDDLVLAAHARPAQTKAATA